jgi:hypothetical protein
MELPERPHSGDYRRVEFVLDPISARPIGKNWKIARNGLQDKATNVPRCKQKPQAVAHHSVPHPGSGYEEGNEPEYGA